MKDHDWEGDGVNNGSAGVHGGSEPGQPDAGPPASRPDSDPSPAQPTNVVPFPGNWFGSVDELVPVHPEPTQPEPTEPEPTQPEPTQPEPIKPRGAVLQAVPAALETGPSSAADASDFWEGEAAALEEVPVPSEARSSITLLRSPDASRRKSPVDPVAPPPSAPPTETGRSPARRGAWRLAFARPGFTRLAFTRLAFVPVVVAAVAVAVVLAANAGLGARASHHPGDTTALTPRHTSAVVTQTVTTPGVTVTTSLRARADRRGSSQRREHSSSGSPIKTSTKAEPAVGARGHSSPTGDSSASSSAPPPTGPTEGAAETASVDSGCAATSPDSGCRP